MVGCVVVVCLFKIAWCKTQIGNYGKKNRKSNLKENEDKE